MGRNTFLAAGSRPAEGSLVVDNPAEEDSTRLAGEGGSSPAAAGLVDSTVVGPGADSMVRLRERARVAGRLLGRLAEGRRGVRRAG